MRHRLEDLGRIAVLLKNVLEKDLFEELPCRNKDFLEYLEEMPKEKREDYLYQLPYQIQEASHRLHDILSIANGYGDDYD